MKKRAYILSDFNDAGTGESFTAGNEPVMMEEGAFTNYQAAGLVSSEAPNGAPKAAAKPARKAAPKTPKTAPKTAGEGNNVT